MRPTSIRATRSILSQDFCGQSANPIIEPAQKSMSDHFAAILSGLKCTRLVQCVELIVFGAEVQTTFSAASGQCWTMANAPAVHFLFAFIAPNSSSDSER